MQPFLSSFSISPSRSSLLKTRVFFGDAGYFPLSLSLLIRADRRECDAISEINKVVRKKKLAHVFTSLNILKATFALLAAPGIQARKSARYRK